MAQQRDNYFLREAKTKLTQAGRIPFFEAILWIANTYPEQTPKRYGCGSWDMLSMSSSGLKFVNKAQAANRATVVWYRSRPRETSNEQE